MVPGSHRKVCGGVGWSGGGWSGVGWFRSVLGFSFKSSWTIEISHNLKYQKYQHPISDIGGQSVNIIPFEIGSQTGYISLENKEYFKKLHKFCQSNIKLRKFKQNISALTVLSSYLIFNSRNHGWGDMDPILPPFPNQWNFLQFIQTRNHSEQSCRKICDISPH